MNVNKKIEDNVFIVSVEGRLDTNTSPELEEELKDELNQDINSLIFNFENLQYISSAGLRLLISTQKKLKANNKTMKITNVNDVVMEIFEMSGFNKILSIN